MGCCPIFLLFGHDHLLHMRAKTAKVRGLVIAIPYFDLLFVIAISLIDKSKLCAMSLRSENSAFKCMNCIIFCCGAAFLCASHHLKFLQWVRVAVHTTRYNHSFLKYVLCFASKPLNTFAHTYEKPALKAFHNDSCDICVAR